MKLNLIMKSARNAVIEIEDGGVFYCKEEYRLVVNNIEYGTTNQVVTSLTDLKPSTHYMIRVEGSLNQSEAIEFTTDYEYVTLNVKAFGAKGDGLSDDTSFIQTAILACPKDGRVLIPAGNYLVTSLFLKSNIKLELEKGAVLVAITDRSRFAVLPGLIESYDEKSEYNLGTWEGNPLPMFSSIITGIEVENVMIYGQGTIHGMASFDNWWENAKLMRGAFRPRLLFLNHCKNVTVQGITFKDSPSWTIHPYFSENLSFYNLFINNPADSPNTDGLDPESCRDVTIMGVHFSLGDDCIAVKSGKLYMGAKYKVPSENILIRQCLMENGHGAVTVGSEMAGGIRKLVVKDCIFQNTDRGLRIKTRRGRGKQAVIEDVIFENITMNHVLSPFVANSFYFCDPDGHSEYVKSKECLPVDDRTPHIKSLFFRNITCENCHYAVAYFCGLPEKKIDMIEMTNITATFADNPEQGIPAMMDDIEPCSRLGIYAYNVTTLLLNNVHISGNAGETIQLENVDSVQQNK
ncbi:glycoside hydrolase family 28 protein [Anaeromicropila populeti]|uniref:Polygalacturonase n=1 Tax=Anaeromicropila populeti TaxID=37658 RepID=A0A1I6I994_9FIRM|nr:glycoside hydrolase family 28 protein [Anaeromicropila populeti]SFR63322.1 Polygalacturonase [Anaeromicropila populeti]